jgi:hypothetical protein
MRVYDSSVTGYAACSRTKILFPLSVKRVRGWYGLGGRCDRNNVNQYLQGAQSGYTMSVVSESDVRYGIIRPTQGVVMQSAEYWPCAYGAFRRCIKRATKCK